MGLTQTEAQAREALLATARLMIEEDGGFSVKTLLERSGISRAGFRQWFTGKDQLLKTLLQLPVQRPAVSVAAQPEASSPATDAWLERRLRVFERALQGIEKRQGKFEQDTNQRIALIAEHLGGMPALPVVVPPVESAPEPELPLAEFSATPDEEQPQTPPVVAQSAERADAAALFEEMMAYKPAPEPPVTEVEMTALLADARRAARDAQLVEPAPRLPHMRRLARGLTGWLAFSGVALVFALVCAGTLFASGALSQAQSTQPSQANFGVAHRQVAANGMARVIALADNGDATSQAVLALAYLRGAGVARDDAAALRWGTVAAEHGQPMAQYLLGTMQAGRDDVAAVRWFHAAALQGNLKAMHNLAIAYSQGQGVARDPVQAAQWFTRAAEQGYRDSAFDMAVLYERGLGVPQDAGEALKWYLIAAAQGDAASSQRAGFLRGQVTVVEADAAAKDAASFAPQLSASGANTLPNI